MREIEIIIHGMNVEDKRGECRRWNGVDCRIIRIISIIIICKLHNAHCFETIYGICVMA